MSRASELRALAEKATPGPWRWWCSKHQTYLATVDRGRQFVMGFVRCGMTGAQPTFQRDHRMVPALKIAEPDHNGAVDLHAHPDAAYIAAWSPETALSALDAIRTLRGALEALHSRTDALMGDTDPIDEDDPNIVAMQGASAALADTAEWEEK